jgi:hypothetical protein
MDQSIFSSNLFKNKHFFKISKKDDDLYYLAKFAEHLDASSAKNNFFCDVTKVENFL